MKRRKSLPELLLPAGSFDALVAAVRGGADAVYVGREKFGARAYARNFTDEELRRAVVYCHLHGVKIYLTLNTLLYENELDEAVEVARSAWQMGVDALIVCDVGLIIRIKKEGIEIPLHASTQMSVHNSFGADEAYRLGCERVVLARELSRENIELTTERCRAETEVFLHGALCVCHSGQCLFSSLVGGRSGNRGECAQPCRLPFDTGYTLSLSDLCLAGHITELIDTGVASLKIEGRMKSAEYVFGVAKIYRRLLDERRNATVGEIKALEKLFSRGGFTDGYFKDDKFSKMEGVRTEEDKRLSREVEEEDFTPDRIKVRAKARVKYGEPCEFSIIGANRSVTVTGDIPERAISSPLSHSEVISRLSKMGATFLSLDESDIELELDGDVNMSKKSLNELRRSAAQAFESCYSIPQKSGNVQDFSWQDGTVSEDFITKNVKRSATFYNPALYDAFCKSDRKDYFDVSFVPLDKFKLSKTLALGVALPPVITEGEIREVRAMLEEAVKSGAKYALISNIGHLSLIKDTGLLGYGDFRLNVTNSDSLGFWQARLPLGVVLSAELDFSDLCGMRGSVITFGRIPLMITERCFIRNKCSCKFDTECPAVRNSVNNALLKDRRGAEFPVLCEYGHRNIIFNSVPTYLGDMTGKLTRSDVGEHFIFSCEDGKNAIKLFDAYKSGVKPTGVFRRLGRRKS